MALRYRSNFLYGTVSGYGTNTVTFSGTGFSSITLPSGYYVPIVLNPGYPGATTPAEIIYIGNINGNTATVLNSSVTSGRGQEGTAAGSGPIGTVWIAGPLTSDFSLTNSIANGDFPAPTASGQYFTSISTSGAKWGGLNASALSGTAGPNFYITSANISGTISGVQVSGYSPNISITGTNVSGFVANANFATNATNATNASNLTGTIAGSQVIGNAPSIVITSSNISGPVANATNATNATNASNFTGSTISNVTITGGSTIAAGVTIASGVIFAGGVSVPATGTITLDQITNVNSWNSLIPFPASQISGTASNLSVLNNIIVSGSGSTFGGVTISGSGLNVTNGGANFSSTITGYNLTINNNSILNNIYSNNAFSYINGLSTNNLYVQTNATVTGSLTVKNNFTVSGSAVLNNGITINGSVVVPSGSIAVSGIAPGSSNQVLTTSGGIVLWATPTSSATVPLGKSYISSQTVVGAGSTSSITTLSSTVNNGITVYGTSGYTIQASGYYRVDVLVPWTRYIGSSPNPLQGPGVVALYINKNGGAIDWSHTYLQAVALQSTYISCVEYFNTGDHITLSANNGTSYSIGTAYANTYATSYLNVTWVSA